MSTTFTDTTAQFRSPFSGMRKVGAPLMQPPALGGDTWAGPPPMTPNMFGPPPMAAPRNPAAGASLLSSIGRPNNGRTYAGLPSPNMMGRGGPGKSFHNSNGGGFGGATFAPPNPATRLDAAAPISPLAHYGDGAGSALNQAYETGAMKPLPSFAMGGDIQAFETGIVNDNMFGQQEAFQPFGTGPAYPIPGGSDVLFTPPVPGKVIPAEQTGISHISSVMEASPMTGFSNAPTVPGAALPAVQPQPPAAFHAPPRAEILANQNAAIDPQGFELTPNGQRAPFTVLPPPPSLQSPISNSPSALASAAPPIPNSPLRIPTSEIPLPGGGHVNQFGQRVGQDLSYLSPAPIDPATARDTRLAQKSDRFLAHATPEQAFAITTARAEAQAKQDAANNAANARFQAERRKHQDTLELEDIRNGNRVQAAREAHQQALTRQGIGLQHADTVKALKEATTQLEHAQSAQAAVSMIDTLREVGTVPDDAAAPIYKIAQTDPKLAKSIAEFYMKQKAESEKDIKPKEYTTSAGQTVPYNPASGASLRLPPTEKPPHANPELHYKEFTRLTKEAATERDPAKKAEILKQADYHKTNAFPVPSQPSQTSTAQSQPSATTPAPSGFLDSYVKQKAK